MDKENEIQEKEKNNLKPDPETLHKTDPQEHMEGPISSLVQDVRKKADNKTDLPARQDEDEDEDENHYNDSVKTD